MPETSETDFDELTVAEKILFVQKLWDRIAEQPDEVEVPDSQRRELDRRLDRLEEDPDQTISWQEVRASIGDDQ